MKKLPIDTKWFRALLDQRKTNIRQVALKMRGLEGRLDYASVHRMLTGKRAMTVSEALQLSRILEVDVEEIVHRATSRPSKNA